MTTIDIYIYIENLNRKPETDDHISLITPNNSKAHMRHFLQKNNILVQIPCKRTIWDSYSKAIKRTWNPKNNKKNRN